MIFHLAIPAKDLMASMDYYHRIGASVHRTYADSAVLNFFGTQLVLHKSWWTSWRPRMYPRHFGIIIDDMESFDEIYASIPKKLLHEDLFQRHTGAKGEHWSFFLCDPSNNMIEFKTYTNKEEIF